MCSSMCLLLRVNRIISGTIITGWKLTTRASSCGVRDGKADFGVEPSRLELMMDVGFDQDKKETKDCRNWWDAFDLSGIPHGKPHQSQT